MNTYIKLLKVTKDDLDELNHVNNVRYIEWVNEVAKEHWFLNTTPQIRESFYWVLINHNINYNSSALIDDIIQLKTFVIKAEGVTSIRIVEIHNNTTDKLVAKSETNWCFINAQTKRPTKIIKEIRDAFNLINR